MTAAPDVVARLGSIVMLMFLAPLIPGIASRTRSVLTGRRGQPVWQLYADLWKLAKRGSVYSGTTTLVFRMAPPVLLATALVAATFVPVGGAGSVLAFPGDVVAFAYTLALGRFVIVLAALDTGSSFEGMGASREVTFATLVEFGLFVVFAALAVATRQLSLSDMLIGPELRDLWSSSGPALAMIIGALFVLMLAEGSRSPVDDPTTHLELTMIHEVIVLDHSGRELAMILYAHALKLAVFGTLLVGVVLPASNAPDAINFGMLMAGLFLLGIAIGVVESTIARLRLPRVPLYISGASALAALALILLLR